MLLNNNFNFSMQHWLARSNSVCRVLVLRKNASGRVMVPGRRRIPDMERCESVGEIRRKDLQGAREARIVPRRADRSPRNSTDRWFAGFGDYAAWRR